MSCKTANFNGIDHHEYHTATLGDIWALFQETDRLLREQSQATDRKFQETDRLIKELGQLSAKPRSRRGCGTAIA